MDWEPHFLLLNSFIWESLRCNLNAKCNTVENVVHIYESHLLYKKLTTYLKVSTMYSKIKFSVGLDFSMW